MKAIMRDAAELKDSGIGYLGYIPQNWQLASAKFFVSISNGSDPKTDGETPVYGSGKGSFRTCGESKDGPTVLLGRKGTVDIPQYIEGKYWNVDTAFDVKAKYGYSLRFFYYLSTCFDYKRYSTQTALPSMTQSNYNSMRIVVPSFSEQNSIYEYLDDRCSKIDAIIAEAKASIEEYKELKQSVIDEAFPVEQRTGRLKHFGVVKTGPFGTQLSANEYVADGVPCINVKNISYGVLNSEDLDYLPESVAERLSEHRLELDDIVFARKGSIDKHAIIKQEQVGWVQGSDCIRLRLREDVLQADYVNLYIGSTFVNEYLAAYSSGATMASLNSSTIGNIPIVIPDVKIQTEIVLSLHKKLTDINALISEKQSLIADLEAYKKSLIYEVVTGKRKVVA